MQCVTLPRITELNPHLLCVLCGGYYIDATSIIECLHAFCKSCIVRYLETHKYCPICDVLVHKTEPLQNIRPDVIRQSIVYKLVPNLYKKEMRNRRNFYVQVNPQQHPACSESKGEITESSNFFSLDDLINLSLEYVNSINDKNFFSVAKGSKRYFRCRAAVTIHSLRKLIAAKYALNVEHKIHMFLDGIQLPDHFRLLDIAYISSWKRVGYIRILYEILTSDQNVTCAEEIEIESLANESLKEDTESTNAVVPVVNVTPEKCEDSSHSAEVAQSVSKSEIKDVDTSSTSNQTPIVTVDLTSSPSKVTNVNISSQPEENVIPANSSAVPSPAVASSPKSIPADETIPPVADEVVVVESVDLTDAEPSEKTESAPSIESSTDTKEKSSSDKSEEKVTKDGAAETSDKVETSAITPTSSEKSSPVASTKAPPEINDVPKSLATKEAPKSASAKKERRGDRSASLPPVPALHMINAAPPRTAVTKPSIPKQIPTTKPPTTTTKPVPTKPVTSSKSLTTVVSSRGQPVVSIPRLPSSPRASSKLTRGYPVTSVAAPLSLIPPPIPVATDLISLYAKSPIMRHPVPKKPPPAGLSILRIDPNTLSPIEASSPASTAMVPVSSGSRKMLPCRPLTTSAYSSVYSCAGASPLHPFGKFSSPPPLYPPFAPSSLHPMNELVRRMFPFPFGSLDAALKAPPLDPAVCGLPSYPQSMTSAVSHFLTAGKSTTTPPKPTKGEKGRRKLAHVGAHVALNGGDKAPFKGGAADPSRGYRRPNAVTNGQIKSAVKRKNSELSDFSINNLIPVDDGAKRPPPPLVHACTADGVNEVCDQVPPAASRNELRKSS